MKIQRSNVPCGECHACCYADAISLHPEYGDNPTQYITVPHALKELADQGVLMLTHKPDLTCVYLDSNGCTIHDRAPALCREFDCRNILKKVGLTKARKLVKKGVLRQAIINRALILLQKRNQQRDTTMTIKDKSSDELIELAKKLAAYHEAGPVLKELVSRFNTLRSINKCHQQQAQTMAIEIQTIHLNAEHASKALQTVINSVGGNLERLGLTHTEKTLITDALTEYGARFTTIASLNDIKAEGIESVLPRFNGYSEVTSILTECATELRYLPIRPVPVMRDEYGHWCHPALSLQPPFWDESTTAEEYKAWYAKHGIETKTTSLGYQDADLWDKYFDAPEVLTEWDPQPPEGVDWFLLCIFDTEDDVYAEWGRRLAGVANESN